MFSTLLNKMTAPPEPFQPPEATRPSSPESILSSITVDAASSNAQSSSSTPPTSIGDSVSVSSASLKLDNTQATPTAATSQYSRRERVAVPTYNVKKLAGTAVHVPRKFLKNEDGTPMGPRQKREPKPRRRAISGDTLVGALDSANSSTDTVTKDADRLVRDGIDALDLEWSVKDLPKSKSQIGLAGSPRKYTKKTTAQKETDSRFKVDTLGSLSKKISVLGKRGRKAFEDGLGLSSGAKVPRELRKLADTPEFLHIDTKPVLHEVWSNGKLVKPEPARKRKKVEQVVEAPKPEAVMPVEKERVNGKREKAWLTKGLYAGQETNLDWFQDRAPDAKVGFPEFKKDGFMPLPMWHGQRLLYVGRDFKLPFDVCSPLPPGQPKPDEWRKTSSNRFVGDAASFWKKEDIFDSFSSKCVCTPETGCDERCQNRIMLYECNDTICAAGRAHCTNRAFGDLQERRKGGGKYRIGVEVIKTPDRGYGVRSNRCFEANQIIVEYTGEIITEDECDRRMNEDYKNNECYYLMSFDQNMILDGTKGSIARFVNHSCKPNCRMVKWLVGGKPRMALFAGDDPIMTGDELTYDYNFDPFSAKNVQECRCGSANCRGVLGPKPKDPKPVKEAIKEVVKAGVRAGKRKLKELFGGEDEEDPVDPRSPKKRKMKAARGIQKSASSASMKVAKGAAKKIKKSVSAPFLNSRKVVGVKRGSGRVVAVKKTRVSSAKRFAKVQSKSSRNSSLTVVASEKSPKGSKSPPPKMSSVGKRSAKKKILGSIYDDRSGTPSRDASNGTVRLIPDSDEE
ncbi:Histone-lysine N-methyltransferase ash1 [Lachnellula cervina]|uniref:Histone-lysine N-methyltransferase ash1 n=1 Tax=Lachnellula cervina TaxID=1316786 RepID=A0A7D8YKX5_9HELO|nr:Histone-lysine N-methyltransferase ash1 [Lachnellula cervina]